jgi:hypothetical protein
MRSLLTSTGRWRYRMATFALAPLFCGCQTSDQSRFEGEVHQRVTIGMRLNVAVDHLGLIELQCSGGNPVDCSRVRKSLMPYSCIERVRLHWTDMPKVVDAIDIPRIACAGL